MEQLSERGRVEQLASGIEFLASIEQLNSGYWLHGTTMKGRYFEVKGIGGNTFEVKVYASRESDVVVYEAEVKAWTVEDLAEALHDMEAALGDEIDAISLGG